MIGLHIIKLIQKYFIKYFAMNLKYEYIFLLCQRIENQYV